MHRFKAAFGAVKNAAKTASSNASESAGYVYKYVDATVKTDTARGIILFTGYAGTGALGLHVMADSTLTRPLYQTIEYANGDISLKHFKNSLKNLEAYNEDKIILSQNERKLNAANALENPKAHYTRDKPLPEIAEARRLHNEFWEQDEIPKT